MILVTGAGGLLGRELIRQLSEAGLSSRGLDHRKPTYSATESIVGDLLRPDDCRIACHGISTVVHTAARHHHSPMPRWGREQFFDANVEMTHNLVRAAEKAGVRHFIYISTDMVYGIPPKRPLTEVDVPAPLGPYGRSKQSSERTCLIARPHGMCVTIFRPRLLIGPGRLGVLQRLFDRIRLGQAIPVLGSGLHRYQMASVSDVAAACILAVKNPLDEIFNLGSADPPPVRTLLSQLCRRANSTSKLRFLPFSIARAALWGLHAARLAPLVPEQFLAAGVDFVLDTTKAQTLLGWQPRLTDVDMLWSAYESYVATLSSGPYTAPQGFRPTAA